MCIDLRTCKQNMFSKLLKLYIIQKKSNISLDIYKHMFFISNEYFKTNRKVYH